MNGLTTPLKIGFNIVLKNFVYEIVNLRIKVSLKISNLAYSLILLFLMKSNI